VRRIVIHGYHEAILARFDHFYGIYGALSAGRWASGSPAFRFSLGDADPPEVAPGTQRHKNNAMQT